MAYFAEIDKNGIVLRVCAVADEHEIDGENWCNNFWGGRWKQTSYNGNIRKQYAGKGMTYDAIKDKFISPQPFPSWTLNNNDDWEAPISYPDNGRVYNWDERNQQWVSIRI